MSDDDGSITVSAENRGSHQSTIRAGASRIRGVVRTAGQWAWRQIRPVVRNRFSVWPVALERQVDLTSDQLVSRGEIPDGEELIVYVHGYLGEGRTDATRMSGQHQAAALEGALDEAYADRSDTYPTVVPVRWHSSTTWTQAKQNADVAGEALASWLEQRPADSVVLVGHSLGARVVLRALATEQHTAVQSVALLSAAVDPGVVCEQYRTGIESLDGSVYNYHSRNDSAVCRLYRFGEFSPALGCVGSHSRSIWQQLPQSPPANYTDIDVTASVQDHFDYLKPTTHTTMGNCIELIVENHLDR